MRNDGMQRYRVTYRQGFGLPDIVSQFALAPELVRRDEYMAIRMLALREAPRAYRDGPRLAASQVEVLVGERWEPRRWPVPSRDLTPDIRESNAAPDSTVEVEVWP